jgi:hypothetical protein
MSPVSHHWISNSAKAVCERGESRSKEVVADLRRQKAGFAPKTNVSFMPPLLGRHALGKKSHERQSWIDLVPKQRH